MKKTYKYIGYRAVYETLKVGQVLKNSYNWSDGYIMYKCPDCGEYAYAGTNDARCSCGVDYVPDELDGTACFDNADAAKKYFDGHVYMIGSNARGVDGRLPEPNAMLLIRPVVVKKIK